MIVSDVMTKNPVYVNPETSVTDAKALMIKEKISKLPVLDKNNRLVGIITKNDLQKAGPSEASTLDIWELGYLLSKLKVEKIMVKDVVTVKSTEVVEEAARIMADKRIGCLPVLNGEDLAGIITETDLFRTFVNMFGARHPGVRAMVEMAEKPGELAKIASAVAEINGNIVSAVTCEGSDVSKRAITIKISNITKNELENILSKCGVKVLDVREMK